MATTSDIRNGLCIRYNNDIYKIIEFLHVKPGKGPAFVIRLLEAALDNPGLMKEGEVVTVIINTEDNMPLSVEMPASVILEVTHTEPGVKGNTATNATKPATVETGAEVNVPLFINEGDKIKVETDKGTYKERVKE